MSSNQTLIPIYTTLGDLGGYLRYPYIFNLVGEWIGWIKQNRDVYSVSGVYVGWLSNDPRILRRRSDGYDRPRETPPAPPDRIIPPAHAPLAPMMPELPMSVYDVLDEDQDLMPTAGFGDRVEDLD
jgi:hypothetical protein